MLVDTFGTGTVSDEQLSKAVARVFDARPGMISRELELKRPIYGPTAAYGHFGRTGETFPWESTPKVGELREAAGAGKASAPAGA
jgi:S-adenosylmethionine synthetase